MIWMRRMTRKPLDSDAGSSNPNPSYLWDGKKKRDRSEQPSDACSAPASPSNTSHTRYIESLGLFKEGWQRKVWSVLCSMKKG